MALVSRDMIIFEQCIRFLNYNIHNHNLIENQNIVQNLRHRKNNFLTFKFDIK